MRSIRDKKINRKTKEKKRIRLWVCISVLILMLILLLSGSFLFQDEIVGETISSPDVEQNDVLNQDPSFMYYTQEVGVIESILKETDSLVYSIHYPILNNDKIDADIAKLVNETIQYAEDSSQKPVSPMDRGMIYMNYDSYLLGKNIVSIIFYVENNSQYYANPETYMISKHYDLSTGRELKNEELFQKDYLAAFSNYCRSYIMEHNDFDYVTSDEVLTPEVENYMNLSLTKDGVLVTFTKDQILSSEKAYQIIIPYKDIKEYLNFDVKEETIVIDENKEQEVEKVEAPTIDPSKPMIALTFDDGPTTKVTNRILDTLKKYDSRATFYVVGNRLSNYNETLQRIVNENSELGSHTFNHKSLTLLHPKDIKKELSAVDDYLDTLFKDYTTTLRPPYGAVNELVADKVGKPMIFWSVDTEDWKNRDCKTIVRNVLNHVKDGDIVLFHDLYESTADAIEIIVPKLIEEGYQLVTVSEMFEAKGITLENGKSFYYAR